MWILKPFPRALLSDSQKYLSILPNLGILQNDVIYFKQFFLLSLNSVVTMPEKLTVYTTLVGLLNARNYNAGGEFVEMLVRNLKEALKTGELENARLMVSWDCHQSTKLL